MCAQAQVNHRLYRGMCRLLVAASVVLPWLPAGVTAEESPAAGEARNPPPAATQPVTPATGPAAPAGAATQPDAASPEEIGKLVAQLNDDRFTERQAASQRLEAIGRSAIPALAKAALGESLEVTLRSVELLRKFLESSDAPTRQAAREALETISRSDRASAAGAAKEALDTLKPPQPGRNVFGGVRQGGLVNVVAVARKMTVRNANGVRDIEVEDNGRKIKIHDDPQQGIKVEIPEVKDGKETPKTYEAKNADELEKKAPEAYKLYKQYAGNAPGAAVIHIQANAAAGDAHSRVAAMRLQMLARQLEAMAKDEQLQNLPQQSKDELKRQLEGIKRQLADLEKHLAPPPQKPESPVGPPPDPTQH